MKRDVLISHTIWQAAAESAGLPLYDRDWSMESYDKACIIYDDIVQTSYDTVSAAVAQAVDSARS